MPELNHNHVGYDNFVLQTNFEDQYESKLDLMKFCTVDDSLEGTVGDVVKIGVYTATNGTEVLQMGEGNTKNIEVSRTEKEYVIELLQNRFPWYDEELMRDPNIIAKGQGHAVVDIFNTSNRKAMNEFAKAELTAEVETFDFDAFVDGVALFPDNEDESLRVFGLINKDDKKEIRKNLKDDLKYITDYTRHGYIGTVNGVNLYTSNIATKGEIILATKNAVTYFNKKGVEIENERTDANKRLNTMYHRKYGIFAFTDTTQAVKLVKKSTTPVG